MDPSRLFSALAGVELADLEIYVVGGAVRDALLGQGEGEGGIGSLSLALTPL